MPRIECGLALRNKISILSTLRNVVYEKRSKKLLNTFLILLGALDVVLSFLEIENFSLNYITSCEKFEKG